MSYSFSFVFLRASIKDGSDFSCDLRVDYLPKFGILKKRHYGWSEVTDEIIKIGLYDSCVGSYWCFYSCLIKDKREPIADMKHLTK